MMRLVSETDSWLSTTRITPRAIAGLEALPNGEREATLAVLAEPFRPTRTYKMTQRRDLDLWRVRVNRDVRITFRLEEAYPLILHIDRHESSDDFVARYRGAEEPGRPLEEIEMMKTAAKHPPMSRNGHAALAMAEPPSLAEKLMRVLGDLVVETTRNERKAEADLALNEVDRLSGLVKELTDQVAQLILEREDSPESKEQLRELLDQARTELTGASRVPPHDMVRLLSEQHELRQELIGAQVRLDEQGRRIGHVRSDLQAQMNELADRVGTLANDVAWLREKEEERQRGWLRRLFRWGSK